MLYFRLKNQCLSISCFFFFFIIIKEFSIFIIIIKNTILYNICHSIIKVRNLTTQKKKKILVLRSSSLHLTYLFIFVSKYDI